MPWLFFPSARTLDRPGRAGRCGDLPAVLGPHGAERRVAGHGCGSGGPRDHLYGVGQAAGLGADVPVRRQDLIVSWEGGAQKTAGMARPPPALV